MEGKYTEGREGGDRFIEIESGIEAGLKFELFFLTFKTFLRAHAKFKIGKLIESDGLAEALADALDDLMGWSAATYLATEVQSDVEREYDVFWRKVHNAFPWDRTDHVYPYGSHSDEGRQRERYKSLTQSREGVFSDSALTNILQAREGLASGLREVADDAGQESSVNAEKAYPSQQWIQALVREISHDKKITDKQRDEIYYRLSREIMSRRDGFTREFVAVKNNPDVEFAATATIGGSFKATLGGGSGELRSEAGYAIDDKGGQTRFDTSVRKVAIAQVKLETGNGRDGELRYEARGKSLDEDDIEEIKVIGQIATAISLPADLAQSGVADRFRRLPMVVGPKDALRKVQEVLVDKLTASTLSPNTSTLAAVGGKYAISVELNFVRRAGKFCLSSFKVEVILLGSVSNDPSGTKGEVPKPFSGQLVTGTSIGIEVKDLIPR